jgi:FkbM family methyltransferase
MELTVLKLITNKIGPFKMAEYLVRTTISRITKCQMQFKLPQMANPVAIRTGMSDMQVFHDIFIWGEYSFLKPVAERTTVLDIGANVGYSSTYFAGIYPKCEVVAVELMHSNFEQLSRNTAFLGKRITTLEAAVWSHNDGVSIADDTFRDGDAWSHHASEAKDGKSLVPSITMFELMQKHAMPRVNICKIDIEGAEFELFATGNRRWVDNCDVILLEIHEDLATFDIVAAMHADGFHSFTAHELTIFYRDAAVAKRFIRDEFLVDANAPQRVKRAA